MSMKKGFTLGAALAMALGTPALAASKVQVSIQAEVEASGRDEAAAGDKAVAAGDYRAALAAYGEGFAETKDPDFLYAMAQVHKAMGSKAEAKSLFQSYVVGEGELKYRGEAAREAGVKLAAQTKDTGKGVVGSVVDTASSAAKAALGTAGGLAASVYTAVKVDVAGKLAASAQAAARKGDEAYAAGNYEEAQASYDEAYEQSQQPLALFAEGMADAHAGNAAEARGELAGYLATGAKGEQANQARQMLLAMGGSTQLVKGVSVAAKVSKEAKAAAASGDKAFKAGRFVDAAKLYAEAYAKKNDAAALYAQGMAQYAEGDVKEAAQSFKSYLASGGRLEFKAQAEAALKASSSAE